MERDVEVVLYYVFFELYDPILDEIMMIVSHHKAFAVAAGFPSIQLYCNSSPAK
jgi:hypothetical protein